MSDKNNEIESDIPAGLRTTTASISARARKTHQQWILEVKGQGRLEERDNKNNETETESNIPADISEIFTASIVARASKGISNRSWKVEVG
jgi:hypothetical protein